MMFCILFLCFCFSHSHTPLPLAYICSRISQVSRCRPLKYQSTMLHCYAVCVCVCVCVLGLLRNANSCFLRVRHCRRRPKPIPRHRKEFFRFRRKDCSARPVSLAGLFSGVLCEVLYVSICLRDKSKVRYTYVLRNVTILWMTCCSRFRQQAGPLKEEVLTRN